MASSQWKFGIKYFISAFILFIILQFDLLWILDIDDSNKHNKIVALIVRVTSGGLDNEGDKR